MTEIRLQAPATIANFGPGFDIFGLALDAPRDLFRIRRTETEGIRVKIVDGRDDLPTEAEKNTAGLAAIHFFKKLGLPARAEIEIIKKMPAGAGLGSSAASAAAAVFGLDKLFRAGLADTAIIEIASQGEVASGGTAHADNVSACFFGGFILVRNRDPLRVDRLQVPEIPVVLRVCRKPVTTSRGFIPEQLSLGRAKEQMALCAAVIHALHTGDLKEIGESINRDHISEPVRSRYIPGYEILKKRALEAGAFGCNVSGGGSSVFAICAPEKQERVAVAMGLPLEGDSEPPFVIQTKSSNQGVKIIDGL